MVDNETNYYIFSFPNNNSSLLLHDIVKKWESLIVTCCLISDFVENTERKRKKLILIKYTKYIKYYLFIYIPPSNQNLFKISIVVNLIYINLAHLILLCEIKK